MFKSQKLAYGVHSCPERKSTITVPEQVKAKRSSRQASKGKTDSLLFGTGDMCARIVKYVLLLYV